MMAGMSDMTRRDFGAGLAILAALGARVRAQQVGTGTLGGSKVFAPALAKAANGSERWAVLDGRFATGEAVAMHESVVPAGTPQTPAHVIKHSELIVVAEGTMSFEHDGVVDQAKAGSVIYVAYGTNHRVWNSGDITARYFVTQVGGDTK
jgi:quercetin dioxygenase-like cupin family protein